MALKSALLILFALFIPALAFAHSGGLNVNGGHRDMESGEYHQHRASGQKGSSYKDAVIKVKVERVIDGDTFVARFPGGKVEKVRLRHTNAPERGEKGYREATYSLKNRIGKKIIDIKVGIHKERGTYLRGYYGRVLADIKGDIKVRISP